MNNEPWYNLPQYNFSSNKVIVLGAGLAGCSVAYSLAKRGYEVHIYDRNSEIASEASGNPAGIVMPLISSAKDVVGKFYYEGFKHVLDLFKNLEVEYQQCGVLDISEKRDRNLSDIVVPESEIEYLSPSEIQKRFSFNSEKGGVFFSRAGFVNPAIFCRNMLSKYSSQIQQHFLSDVKKIKNIKGLWSIIDSKGGVIDQAEILVIANANNCNGSDFLSWVPVEPVRGQITYLDSLPIPIKTIINSDGYIIPEVGGSYVIGATYDRGDLSVVQTCESNKENLRKIEKIIGKIPDLDITKLKGRASLRATLHDRRAVVGMVPDYEGFLKDYEDLKYGRRFKKYPDGQYLKGLFVSAAHGSRGLTSCPISGEIIAQLINKEPIIFDRDIINALNPARFIIRHLRK